MTLIECVNLNLTYDDCVAVKNFSFSFKTGDYVCIVGENGSGKSSVVKAILGLNSNFKKNGMVNFKELKHYEIGYLPQRTSFKTDFPASVFEVVLSGFCSKTGFFSFYTKKQKSKVLDILKILEISHLKLSSFKTLSKGQQQRVLFARAICATEKILFLDEPCAGFDPVITSKFYELINQLNVQKNVAIVMITHDLNKILNYAKTIIHLKKEPIFIGNCSEYVNSDVGKKFLGGLTNC